MTDRERRGAVAERAARAGARHAVEAYRTDLPIETKDHRTDVVTRADREAQERVVAEIRDAFPGEPVVGEEDETRRSVPGEGPGWIVDPIDGTSNFVRGVPVWGTSVAAVVDSEAVAAATVLPAVEDTVVAPGTTADGDAPTLNGTPIAVSDREDPATFQVAVTMWWDRDDRDAFARLCEGVVSRFADLRRFGSAQATLAFVATGALDAAVTDVPTHPWDTVAGVHLVREAGGTVTDVDGDRWTPDATGLVASSGEAHDAVLDAVRGG